MYLLNINDVDCNCLWLMMSPWVNCCWFRVLNFISGEWSECHDAQMLVSQPKVYPAHWSLSTPLFIKINVVLYSVRLETSNWDPKLIRECLLRSKSEKGEDCFPRDVYALGLLYSTRGVALCWPIETGLRHFCIHFYIQNPNPGLQSVSWT